MKEIHSRMRFLFLFIININNIFFVFPVVNSDIITLDQENNIGGSWDISSDCQYYEESESICSDTKYEDTEEKQVGFWTNCDKVECSITYTAQEEYLELAEEISFRVFGYPTSKLIIKSDSLGETQFTIGTTDDGGWISYTLKGRIGSKNLTFTLKEGSDILIFDKIQVHTVGSSSTTESYMTSTTETPDDSSTKLSHPPVESTQTTNPPSDSSTMKSNPPDESTPNTSTPDDSTSNSNPTEDSTKILNPSTEPIPNSTPPFQSTSTEESATTDSSTPTKEIPDPENPYPTDKLDTTLDLTENGPWSTECVYGQSIPALVVACPNTSRSGSGPLNKLGYWTPCEKTSCTISYNANIPVGKVREVSLQYFASSGASVTVRSEYFELPIQGSGRWVDWPLIGGYGPATTLTITADNGLSSGIVIFEEIRIRTVDGQFLTTPSSTMTTTSKPPFTTEEPTTTIYEYSTLETTTRVFPDNGNDMAELYLLLILIAVGVVIVLMTLLIFITCVRRVCCKRRNQNQEKTEDEEKGKTAPARMVVSPPQRLNDNVQFRAIPLRVPSPPITPPPGNGNTGMTLQASTSSLNGIKPRSPYKEGGIYFRGSDPARRDERLPKLFPRMEKASSMYY